MKKLKLRHWQDIVNALVGLVVMLSPWWLGFTDSMAASANAVVVGLALIATATGAILVPRPWEEWTEFALGIWLIMSPWVLQYALERENRLVMVALGAVIVLISLWTLLVDKEYRSWGSDSGAP